MSRLYKVVATFVEIYETEVYADNEAEAYAEAKYEIDWGVVGSPEYEDVEFEVIEIDDD